MKILHIISSRGWGGAENSAIYLAKKQIEKGHKPLFFIHSLNKKMRFLLENNGVPYYSIFDPERKNIFALKKAIDICKKENTDIIHTHLGTGSYIGVLAGNYLGIPVLSTINIFSGFPYYALADKLCFSSAALKDYFIKYFSTGEYKNYKPAYTERIINHIFRFKYSFLAPGEIESKMDIAFERINEGRFIDCNYNAGANDDEIFQRFKEFFNIGITGRVTQQKGQVYFVKAAELLLKDKNSNALRYSKPLMFHIVGSGNDEKKLKKTVKKMGIEGSFMFWGYQSDVRKFVSMFDIAVSCSLNEPFGINNLEYMFMKKPCIATNIGGIPEVYGDTNIIIPPKDEVKLKEAIETYINNPKYMREEALKGFERANRLFRSDISADKVISMYEEIVKRQDPSL
ncbi:MAG: glycosyltransferase [Deltaproteobacteria bacterium]|jgi:glycosyltransferase involved in cell wall biosynthesis|nr:glycosyltransferase [Deltaproteobacteria bacterium]